MTCDKIYTNTLRAEFARPISAEAHREQFEAIAEAMECLQELIESADTTQDNIFNNGTAASGDTLSPANGTLQFVSITGATDLSLAIPGADDPKVVYLVVRDAGDESANSRFTFSNGLSWTTRSKTPHDSSPWPPEGTAGNYGAVVQCIWDGVGWLYLIYGRNDIDFDAVASLNDVFRWL